MPVLRAIERTADGLNITRSNGTVLTITSVDIPSNVKSQSIANIEAWVNAWLLTNGYMAVCKIASVTPLQIDIVIGDNVPPDYFTKFSLAYPGNPP